MGHMFPQWHKLYKQVRNDKLFSALVILGVLVFTTTSFLADTSNKVLFITFLALLWYAEKTRIIANETTTQTELLLKPVPVLYVKNVEELYERLPIKEAGEIKLTLKQKYGLPPESGGTENSNYYLSLKNTGKGTALNVVVSVEQGRNWVSKPISLAPNEERPIKLFDHTKERDHHRIGISDLSDATLEISAHSADEERMNSKRPYRFRYKVVDVINGEVEFLG